MHTILKHILSRCSISLYLNMFGFDDDELNSILMAKALDPNITTLITLDKSQAGGSGYKAQNNTQSVFTDNDTLNRFTAELIAEHMAAQKNARGSGGK